MVKSLTVVGTAAALLVAVAPGTGSAEASTALGTTTIRTPNHPCGFDHSKTCYGTVQVSEEPDAAPAAAGTRHYVTHTDSYTEYGWDYPSDSLYTVSVTTRDWFDGSAAGNVWVNKHCEATGWKGWSCPTGLAQKAGTFWDPSEYGGAQTAWGDFITEFHYPCPVCSEQDQTYIRIWVTPSGSYHHFEGH